MKTEPTSILYVITKATWGGAQRYVYDLITEAQRQGYRPMLAAGEWGLLSERVEELGVPVYRIEGLARNISLVGEFKALASLSNLCRTLRPDIVHLNSSKAGFSGAVAAKLAGVKRIFFTAHGWAFSEDRSFLAKAFFSVLHFFTVLLSTRTIANSEATAHAVRWWPFSSRKIQVIPLGIGPIDFLERKAARSALMNIDASLAPAKETVWVGTIAELHRNKGLDIGVQAWKEAAPSGAQWVVLGGGEEVERLQDQASNGSGIHFLGFVPDAARYLEAFDLFILPSRTESFGYVLLEAGAAGVPCIAANVGGIPELIPNEKMPPIGALFKPNDPTDLSLYIKAYLRDPASLKNTGEVLKSYVLEKFNLKKMLDKTFELY